MRKSHVHFCNEHFSNMYIFSMVWRLASVKFCFVSTKTIRRTLGLDFCCENVARTSKYENAFWIGSKRACNLNKIYFIRSLWDLFRKFWHGRPSDFERIQFGSIPNWMHIQIFWLFETRIFYENIRCVVMGVF